jgi:NitT/TauT family transport system permease protein
MFSRREVPETVVARTVGLLILGFVGSLALGVATGLALGAWPLLDRALSPYLIGLQSLPNAVLVPLGLLLAGPSVTTVVALTVVGATPAIAIGTRDAVQTIPPLLIRAGRTMGARGLTLLRTVILPAAMPGVIDSLQFGWAFAFRAVVAAEIIIGTGLGAFLREATTEQRSDEVLAVVLVILVLGILVDRLGFAQIRTRLRADRGLGGPA